jgi:predicted lipoprotein
MKRLLILPFAALLAFAACKKNDNGDTPSQPATETAVLSNFVDNVARAQYDDLAAKADALHASIQALQSNATDDNLNAARNAWKDMRAVWERCEGFLFGPVEDDNYDPYMDTWPTDYIQMDSLLASSGTLTLQDIQGITLSLRGFHPVEYILFGRNASRKASELTNRQMQYLASLSEDLRNNCRALANSWDAAGGNYGAQILNAGTEDSKYGSRREVFLAIADGLIAICEEVGEGKMEEPFAQQDPQKVESPYSGNSIADFRNNIVGLQNVYLGRYNSDGPGINDLVALGNVALDNKLQAQITAAINSFDNITHPFEQAIFDQKPQILQTQAALAELKTTLEDELKPYLNQVVKD